FIITTSDQAVVDKMRAAREELEELQKALGEASPVDQQFDDEIADMMDDAISEMDQKGDEFVKANEEIVERTKQEWEALRDHRAEVVGGLIDLGTTLTDSTISKNLFNILSGFLNKF
ncbi:MAG: hypothetical protein AAFY41_15725, partial [Bacteroidota bacterium]